MSGSRLPFRPSTAALFALIAGLIASTVLFVGLRRLEHDKVELDFQQRAHVRTLAVQQQLGETVQVLKILNQSFATFETISREQFQLFTQPLLERHPYVQAFNFHRFLSPLQRVAYEEQMRKRDPSYVMMQMRDGRLVPAQPRDFHLVVDYIAPIRGNEAAFGLDVSANPHLIEAVQRSIDTGFPSSTGLLNLAQGGGKQRGFLVVMPVYRPGIPLHDVNARRFAAIGDTAAVFNAANMIETILSTNGLLSDSWLSISVYASGVADDRHLAFRKGSPPSSHNAAWLPQWIFYDQPANVVYDFDVAGKPWSMSVLAEPLFFTSRNTGSLYGLIAGVLISLLTAGYIQTLSSRARRVHMLVEQRTMELRHANALLTEDIAARKRTEEALQLRQRAIEASANAIIITSADGPNYPIEYVNPAFERITGYPSADVIGRSTSLMWAGDPDQPEIQEIHATARERREGHAILRCYAKDGSLIWSDVYIAPVREESGQVTHFVIALYDITALKRYQAELEFQANRDSLTGLANRNLLHDRLKQATAYAMRYGHPVWVLFFNLDRFKFVNDTLGRRAGDSVLQSVAQCLQQAVRETDTVARLGADEFVLVLSERTNENLSPAVVQRIMNTIAHPIVIDGYEFVMQCSVGIAVAPSDGIDPESLIKHAGIAMYRAKETGRNNFQFYTSSMNEHAMERLRIESDLRNALEREEFALHYQPQVDLSTGRVIGMETLIRWRHPVLGMIPPVRFIGMAEELGLIVPIGAWVLRTACRQSIAWQHAGFGAVRVAVNLSARQFYQQDLVASIHSILDETGLEPRLLELELTESMMMTDVENAVAILRKLKTLGVQLSIDDFGTGYSSLAYLKRFPIDLLKIDQSFVRDIAVDPDDAAIVLSTISLAHSLRLKVIAEGVESEAQLAFLQRNGCDYMQGYYFSHPLPPEECDQLLRHGKSMPLPDDSPVTRMQTLLIVDDDADTVSALRLILRQDGYRILTAETNKDALEQLARHPIQVVLCNLDVPSVDGTELLAHIKMLYPDAMRIMLTAQAEIETVVHAVNHSEVYRVFTRPWSDQELRNSICEAFRRYWIKNGAHITSPSLFLQA